MAAVRCRRCGAVVTARGEGEGIETTYGDSFRRRCKSRSGASETDFSSTLPECPEMELALQRAAFRISREARRRAPAVPPSLPDEAAASVAQPLTGG